MRKENAELRKQLESARKQLEEETLLRVDIENRMQSLREELQFNKQIYEQVSFFLPKLFVFVFFCTKKKKIIAKFFRFVFKL